MDAPTPHTDVPPTRLALLFLLFFSICWGLGYASLNLIDWRQAPGGLEDVAAYANLVTMPPSGELYDHTQFRILIPYLARPIYRLANGHIGTWDPVMFALLLVNSFFVALTALLLLVVCSRQLGSYTVALGAALIYLLNFAIPNLRLVGLIDAGEGFFLMLLVFVLSRHLFWTLPLIGLLGATAKESFVPFLIVFTLTWWLVSPSLRRRTAAVWIVASWCTALASLATLQWTITGVFRSPLRFAEDLHHGTAYFSHFIHSLADRHLWYIFFWLLPLSLFRLGRLPRDWRIATAATCVAAFVLDAYYGGEPGTIGRALFSIAGPLLSASVALLLFTPAASEKPVAPAL